MAIHFGGFTYIHGVLVVALFGPKGVQPYGRVIVLHLTVLFGGWIVMMLGSPLLALVLLVLLKTAAHVRAHKAERRKFAVGDRLDAEAETVYP